MKRIEILLEDDEIFLLRGQVRMMQLMIPESNEMVDSFVRKMLEATDMVNDDYRKEIGKMQRALRKIKQTPEYAEFMEQMKKFEKILIKEMQSEEN